MKKINLFCLLIGFVSCQTFERKLIVNSQPEGADVFIQAQGETLKKVGVTPLSLNLDQELRDGKNYQLSVVKDGHQTQSVVLPANSLSKQVDISVRLLELVSRRQADESVTIVSKQVAEIQQFITSKQFDQAERTLNLLITQYPSVATFHELLGNVNYLRRDLAMALKNYKKANTIQPGNVDTLRMISKIESLRPDLKTGEQR